MAKKNLKFELNPLLSGPTLEARTRTGSPYRLLPISEIDGDPEQPRRQFEAEALAELAASIKEYGLLSPILVRVTAGGTYRVVAGERRLRASRLLGLDTIPAIIDSDDGEEKSTLAKQLVENIQRQDLTPLERAIAMAQLRDRHAWSVREIARRLGTSKSLVQRSLDLLALPDDLQAAIQAGAAETKVALLAQLEDREIRRQLLDRLDEISRDGLEVQIGRVLRGEPLFFGQQEEVSHGGTATEDRTAKERAVKKRRTISAEDKRLVEDLQRTLGTKVQIARTSRKAEQGKMVIDFYSSDDLSEIVRRLMA